MLSKLRNVFFVQNSLSRRLLVYILLVSSLFTLISTGSQLYLEFQSEVKLVQERMDLVPNQYVGPLTNELWEVDTEQISVLIKSIYALPDVTFVELNDSTFSKKSLVLGKRLVEQSVTKVYPLLYKKRKSDAISLGELSIEFTYSNIIKHLKETLVLIFVVQLLKTFAMSLFIFWIIQRLIIRHINDIAEYLYALRIGSLEAPLTINRVESEKGDELSEVVRSVNHMRVQLANEMADHEHSQQLLAESEQRLRTTLNSLTEGVISYDLQGRIVAVNTAAEKLTGWSKTCAVGQYINDVFKCVEAKSIFPTSEVGDNSANFSELISRTGDVYLIASSKAPIITDQISFLGAVLVFRDVTKEVQLRQTAHHNDKLHALGRLSGGIAHDINNILAVITGASELIAMDPNMAAQHKELLGRITDSSQRGGDIIERLLAFSRKGMKKREKLDIHVMIAGTVEMLSQGENKNIAIVVEKYADQSIILGDYSSLESGLMNLGINAFHAMKKGGELCIRTKNITLTLSDCESKQMALKPGSYISIEVSDTGTGIAPEIIPFIFEPFFTTKLQPEGVGLGLWSVYGAIQDHGGDVKVLSEVNRGTCFHILLPVLSSSVVSGVRTGLQRVGRETILLVDDEQEVLKTEAAILESLGYQVLSAHSGKAAIALFREKYRNIDLIILDLIMPEMDGIETLKEINAINSDCSVLINSGYSEQILRQRLNDYRNIYFLKKPHSRQALDEKLTLIFDH